MKENRRLVHVHTPLLPEDQRGRSCHRMQMRFQNRRVILSVYEDDYVLTFKSLIDGKVVRTTVPLSREAVAAIIAMYESLPDERQAADLELLGERFVPLRKPQASVVVAESEAMREGAI